MFKKRQALWNKSAKTELEIYRCPCGFAINSETDNRSSADTGNKVAAHLLDCTYKYCQVTLQSKLSLILLDLVPVVISLSLSVPKAT